MKDSGYLFLLTILSLVVMAISSMAAFDTSKTSSDKPIDWNNVGTFLGIKFGSSFSPGGLFRVFSCNDPTVYANSDLLGPYTGPCDKEVSHLDPQKCTEAQDRTTSQCKTRCEEQKFCKLYRTKLVSLDWKCGTNDTITRHWHHCDAEVICDCELSIF